MEYRSFWTGLLAVFAALTFAGCSQNDKMRPPAISFKPQNAPVVPRSMNQMSREVGIRVSYMPKSTYARKRASSMTPRFITIHSTANPKGDANAHSRYLNSGKSRSLNWHFTSTSSEPTSTFPRRKQAITRTIPVRETNTP